MSALMDKPLSPDIPHFASVLRYRIGSWQFALERQMFASDQLARRYDKVAAAWPRMLRRLGFESAYSALASRLLEPDGERLQDGSAMLDCGAGSGAMSLAIAAASGARLSHHLLDASPRMLEVASRQFERAGLRATIALGGVGALPYPDACFDLVTAAHVLEHLPDPARGIAELSRVLKPQGLLLISVTRRGLFGALVQLKWRVHCVAASEITGLLERSGLEQVRTVELGGPWWCRRMSMAVAATRAETSP